MFAVTIPLLDDIVIMFSISVLTIYIFNKLKLPPILGFLLAGLIVGPYGLGFVNAVSEVEILAEIGVIFILFSIGLEFSVSKLMKMKKNILLGGSFQVILTTVIFAFLSSFFFSLNTSIFIGFMAALSSTAIILKLHQTAGSLESPYGNVSLSILIFQDIAILPMILLVPLLAGTNANLTEAILIFFAKIIGIALFMFLSIKYVMPKLIFMLAKTRIKELFSITVLVFCLFIVWICSQFDISLALGAFLAGLILSETEFNHDAMEFIEPFKDIFASFFFVSIGMLLNLSFVADNLVTILGGSLALIILKFIIVFGTARLLGYSGRTSFITGMIMAQVGEFSFVLAKTGFGAELITESLYQTFIASAVITITATPFMFKGSTSLASRLNKSLSKLSNNEKGISNTDSKKLDDHLVIIGFGVNGRNLSNAANIAGLDHIIIEMNPVTVKEETAKGTNMIYGDATQEAILDHAYIKNAKFCVVVISDPAAVRDIAKKVKEMNPSVHLLIRTRFVQETDELFKLGADEVIPEEFETSVEIFSRILTYYLIPHNKIVEITDTIRSKGYSMFRGKSNTNDMNSLKLSMPEHEVLSIQVNEASQLKNKKISDLTIRNDYKTSLIAIKPDNKDIIVNPNAEIEIKTNDILVLFGKKDMLHKLIEDLN